MTSLYTKALAAINSEEDFDVFNYLLIVSKLLDNPIQKKQGRELVIRALNVKYKFFDHEKILRAMVRKSGLYPYLYSEFDNFNAGELIATNIFKSPGNESFVFHEMQRNIFNLLIDGNSVVLSAPTSMGKSAIVDSLISTDKYLKIVIVVPTIALIDETRRRVSEKFSKAYDIIYHSAQKISKDKCIYILTQERVNEREDLENIDLFIIDEFYKLSFKRKNNQIFYDERVVALNVALSKLLAVSKQFYMIGPNIDFVTGLNKLKNSFVFVNSDFNTVAINVFEYNLPPSNDDSKYNKTIELLNEKGQFIIYCKSPKVAEQIAEKLFQAGIAYESDEEEYLLWLEDNYSPHWQYINSVRTGVGLHYGTLPRVIQQYTIDLFNEKKIRILICTSTIIEGVNTNAEHVIIFDNRNGINSIDKFTHDNIKGRAGRMKHHFIGNVHCLEKIPENKVAETSVEIPIGIQDESTPLGLIAGIQDEHLQAAAMDRLNEYLSENSLPKEIIKKHPTYDIDVVLELFREIDLIDNDMLKMLCFSRYPDKNAMTQISKNILITSKRTLAINSVSTDIENIRGMIFSYISAENHQSYFKSQIDRVINNKESALTISDAINRELKITRNVFCYTIPKSLALQQDIVNFIAKKRNINSFADYSSIIHKFENSHLPGNLSALEEMGVPIQLLQKIVFPDSALLDIESAINHLIKIYKDEQDSLSKIEKVFIKRALIS